MGNEPKKHRSDVCAGCGCVRGLHAKRLGDVGTPEADSWIHAGACTNEDCVGVLGCTAFVEPLPNAPCSREECRKLCEAAELAAESMAEDADGALCDTLWTKGVPGTTVYELLYGAALDWRGQQEKNSTRGDHDSAAVPRAAESSKGSVPTAGQPGAAETHHAPPGSASGYLGSWCAQCGPDVKVDEDGCCAMCGADAVGDGADQALRLRDENARLRQIARDAYEVWAGSELGRAETAAEAYAIRIVEKMRDEIARALPEPKGGG